MARGSLATYRAKRDFDRTAEPKGKRGGRGGQRFVIQKHDATRLHYDLRLELDGVFKSWAVTRGPSLVAGEKRLAVEVEDHPLDYGGFEGTIPEGEYGGGTVIVWDRGTWTAEGDPHRGFAKGHLDFELRGEKLRGRWHLVRMRRKGREKRDNWLLIKGDDDAARPAAAADILAERPESVKTGRGIEEVATGRPRGRTPRAASEKKNPKDDEETAAAPLPLFVEPCLATRVDRAPAGRRWVHEIKFDGYRVQARVEKGRVRLLTRSGLDWTSRFGKGLAKTLAALPLRTALIDGEIVVEGPGGATEFSALQADLSDGRSDRFIFYAFDLLHLDGRDLRGLGLEDRKAALARVFPKDGGVLRYSEHFEADGATMQRHACRLALEGVMSKLRDAPYRSGRHKDWVKAKCSEREEFVVGGYVPSTTASDAIGSLVLGQYEGGKLRHVGRVGTGFAMAEARALRKRLDRLTAERSPFTGRLAAEQARGVRFARPELVAEIEYRGWTADRNLRHAAFRGLREDKPAADVVAERPAKAGTTASDRPALTHPDRVYWPDAGVTKEGLAEYVAEVWRLLAPHVVGRPLALLRCPDGADGDCFFQKHSWRGMAKGVRVTKDSTGGEEVLSIDALEGAVALVQSGVLEIHPWGATLADIEHPDMLTFDLDPGDGVGWAAVADAARNVRERLLAKGLSAFLKTSGGKGLHVVVPLHPRAGWAAAKALCRAVAVEMAADDPARYVATATKARRPGRIFVDYLRNGRGATAVAAYSPRARAGAPVS
ncbi:MAG: DNA ligase D, partial [Alphaproteobacteria bacterium]